MPSDSVKVVILHGNPADGFAIYGPFDDVEAAHHFVDGTRFVDAWFIMPMIDPYE